jgi:hypothetical protein
MPGHRANEHDVPGNEYSPDLLCKQEVVGRFRSAHSERYETPVVPGSLPYRSLCANLVVRLKVVGNAGHDHSGLEQKMPLH